MRRVVIVVNHHGSSIPYGQSYSTVLDLLEGIVCRRTIVALMYGTGAISSTWPERCCSHSAQSVLAHNRTPRQRSIGTALSAAVAAGRTPVSVRPAPPQSFSNVGCLGVNMSVGYSGNMVGQQQHAQHLRRRRTVLRWKTRCAGRTIATIRAPAVRVRHRARTSLTFLFDQPVFLDTFTVASLSRLSNGTERRRRIRYEWMDVRVFDQEATIC
ncbi:MAG: hypothetical protein R2854_09310 [Caldilineaceae bacterium]